MAGRTRAREVDRPPDDDVPVDPQRQRDAAREACLRLLTVRARSRRELEQALTRRGIDAEVAAEVLDRLQDVGLIDDAAYALALAHTQHRVQAKARRSVAATLRQRGVSDEDTRRALATIDTDSESRVAGELAARRARAMRSLAPDVARRRLTAMLARRGFSAETCQVAVRAALADRDAVQPDQWD